MNVIRKIRRFDPYGSMRLMSVTCHACGRRQDDILFVEGHGWAMDHLRSDHPTLYAGEPQLAELFDLQPYRRP